MKIILWLLSLTIICNVYASDLAIGSTITSPLSGCNLSSTEIVKVTIINAATSAYSGTCDVSYTVGTNPTVTESITIPVLNVGGTYIYEFSVTVDLSNCGVHTIDLDVFDSGDVNLTNNSLTVNVTSDCNPIAGSFTGPSNVCETGNSGQIDLIGNTGIITDWVFSENSGATFTSTGNTSASQTFLNITSPRLYRVYFDSQYGFCPSDSTDFSIAIDNASIAGILSSDSSHCDTIYPTTLYLNGYNGNIINYQLSLDGGSNYTNFTNPFDTLQYIEYGNAFQFFAITQNGTCPTDSSNIVTINILDGPEAGEITGEDSLCAGTTTTDLTLSNYNGVILDWEYSLDDGLSWTGTGLTSPGVTLSSITGNSKIRAIVENAPCGTDTAFFDIVVIPASDAGILQGTFEFCSATNSGLLNTNAVNGTILGWISSSDNGSTFTDISNSNDTLFYTNISQTTTYAVIAQFASCTPDTSNFVTISINSPSVAGVLLSSDSVCSAEVGTEITLSGNQGTVIDWLYSANNGMTWISSGITDSTYQISDVYGQIEIMAIIQNGTCEADTAEKTVFFYGPFNSFSLTDTILSGDSIQLDAGSGVSFEWTPNIDINNNLISNPTVSPTTSTDYQVLIADSSGCEYSSIHSIIVVVNSALLEVNNILTPNGDGYNDVWHIENIELFPDNSVTVFNSYGQIIYNAEPYLNDWNATDSNLPDGTYFYIINPEPNQPPVKGTITVINSK
jgi:gliding motility-associated-like protein